MLHDTTSFDHGLRKQRAIDNDSFSTFQRRSFLHPAVYLIAITNPPDTITHQVPTLPSSQVQDAARPLSHLQFLGEVISGRIRIAALYRL